MSLSILIMIALTPGTIEGAIVEYPIWHNPNLLPSFKSMGTWLDVPSRSVLFTPGDEQSFLYLIVKGLACLSLIEADGSERVVRYTHPYDLLGLPSALVGRLPKYTATTITPCSVLALPRSPFIQALRSDPIINELTILMLVSTIAQLCEHEALPRPRLSLDRRVAAGLLHLAHRTTSSDPIVKLTLTHQQLADSLSLHRVSVTRSLQRLVKRDLAMLQYGTITLKDLDGLARFVETEDSPTRSLNGETTGSRQL